MCQCNSDMSMSVKHHLDSKMNTPSVKQSGEINPKHKDSHLTRFSFNHMLCSLFKDTRICTKHHIPISSSSSSVLCASGMLHARLFSAPR